MMLPFVSAPVMVVKVAPSAVPFAATACTLNVVAVPSTSAVMDAVTVVFCLSFLQELNVMAPKPWLTQ